MANYKKISMDNLVITLSEAFNLLLKRVDKLEEKIELLENGEIRTQASTDAEFSGEVF
tara:strand:+ start:2117 stop:2290 length:174 start_codon:yes stop_codon:yes gene_type:complete